MKLQGSLRPEQEAIGALLRRQVQDGGPPAAQLGDSNGMLLRSPSSVAAMLSGTSATGFHRSPRTGVADLFAASGADGEAGASVAELELVQLRERYHRLEERFAAMERAARAEIGELRARLQEAHQELADARVAQAVRGCDPRARHGAAARSAARCEATSQMRCFVVWRAFAALSCGGLGGGSSTISSSQDFYAAALRHHVASGLQLPLRLLHRARQRAAVKAAFDAWRINRSEAISTRFRGWMDQGFLPWEACLSAVALAAGRRARLAFAALAARCFVEWKRCYQTHRRLARHWRWLGRERQVLREYFGLLLRACVAGQGERIRALRVAASAALRGNSPGAGSQRRHSPLPPKAEGAAAGPLAAAALRMQPPPVADGGKPLSAAAWLRPQPLAVAALTPAVAAGSLEELASRRLLPSRESGLGR